MSKNKHTMQKVADIESALKKIQVKLGSLLARSGILASQWSQYKNGYRSPTLETWARAEKALGSIQEDVKDER